MPTATITAVAAPDRRHTCRYLVPRSFKRRTTGVLDRCTAEVAEEGGEIELCVEHLAAALQLLARRGIIPGGTDA